MEEEQNKESALNSLPFDTALIVASYLSFQDVCALGSCSRFLRDISKWAPLWAYLCNRQWPDPAVLADYTEFSTLGYSNPFPLKGGWRSLYIKKHKEVARRIRYILEIVDNSWEGNYLVAYNECLDLLSLAGAGKMDVEKLLFKPELSVRANLLGLHYCIKHLHVPSVQVVEALERRNIAKRGVYIEWWELVHNDEYGSAYYDECHSHRGSLERLAAMKDEEEAERVFQGLTPSFIDLFAGLLVFDPEHADKILFGSKTGSESGRGSGSGTEV